MIVRRCTVVGLVALAATALRLNAQCDRAHSDDATTIAGREWRLHVDAWLNLMPGVGKQIDSLAPFRAILRIAPVDSATSPTHVTIDSAWVVSGLHRAPIRPLTYEGDRDSVGATRRLWGGPRWLLQADSVEIVVRAVIGNQSVCLGTPRMKLTRAD